MVEVDHRVPFYKGAELFRFGVGSERCVLAGFHDQAESDAIIPVLNQLSQNSQIYMMVDGPAKRRLLSSGFKMTRFESAGNFQQDFASIKADVVLTGKSSVPTLEYELTLNAHVNKIPVVWLEDYPGNIFPHYQSIGLPDQVRPDYLCVVNEQAKADELNYAQYLTSEQVIVTGQPGFDYLADEDILQLRSSVRQKIGLGEETKLAVYIGGKDVATTETLEVLVKQLARLPNSMRLVVRNHPGNQWLDQDSINQLVEPISNQVIDSNTISTSDITAAGDLIISYGSLEGIKAVIRQIPSFHILIPQILQKAEDGFKNRLLLPPVVRDGSSPAAYTEEEVGYYLQKMISDRQFIEGLSQKMRLWKTDGRSAERVAKIVRMAADR